MTPQAKTKRFLDSLWEWGQVTCFFMSCLILLAAIFGSPPVEHFVSEDVTPAVMWLANLMYTSVSYMLPLWGVFLVFAVIMQFVELWLEKRRGK